MDVKAAIQTGDAAALRAALAEDPARANQLIEWGKNCQIRTHPLHYISDILFSGRLERGKELPLVDALLESGADPNHQARGGETPLIGAASLGAEKVGLRLLDAGANSRALGAGKETALHWAAHLGLDRLTARLIEKGADLNLKDAQYDSPPLGWALHGRFNSPAGSLGNHPQVVAALISAGARVQPEWLAQIEADPEMSAALRRD
ncbi:MAG TPA: ankyrin repeat domain-containing protein [Bryobacteraceae bacterium]|nr:ankyrin repeat domain-containing protein [Bryobacteraceae bacterium]